MMQVYAEDVWMKHLSLALIGLLVLFIGGLFTSKLD